MGVSAALQAAGKKHASLFVGQWAPAFLLLGLYDQLVQPAAAPTATIRLLRDGCLAASRSDARTRT